MPEAMCRAASVVTAADTPRRVAKERPARVHPRAIRSGEWRRSHDKFWPRATLREPTSFGHVPRCAPILSACCARAFLATGSCRYRPCSNRIHSDSEPVRFTCDEVARVCCVSVKVSDATYVISEADRAARADAAAALDSPSSFDAARAESRAEKFIDIRCAPRVAVTSRYGGM